MEIDCPECDAEFDATGTAECPECGFGPERCDHPQGYRDSEWVYSVDEGKHVERVFCSKCGLPTTDM